MREGVCNRFGWVLCVGYYVCVHQQVGWAACMDSNVVMFGSLQLVLVSHDVILGTLLCAD